jgi:hypothetical protein
MTRSRQEILREQLARAGVDVAEAVREVREVLLGLASDIEGLDKRVKQLEAETRDA